ncbi:MAG: DNA polymerase III subunit beta [Nitrosomonas sp.]|nr:MAG: DNA polymerase III subunit beta [Nitrosomonas sp.]
MLLIHTSRDLLLKPVQTVSGVIERRQAFPILSNILIRQDREKTTFLASDSDIQIRTDILPGLAPEQPFSLTVSAKKLQDILRSLPNDGEISLIKKEDFLQLKSGKSAFNLQILPAEDFPEIIETAEPEATASLHQKTLKNLLRYVQFCIAQQNIRYYMNGLLLSIQGNQLVGVSTDGHRLALLAIELDQTQPKQDVIIPRKTALELSKLLNDSEEPVKIEYFHKKICFSFSNIVLISKVIEGKFPDYNRVIPQENNKTFIINRLLLLQALQRVSILSNINENFRGVRLIINPGNLCIICKNSEQEEAQEDLDIEYHHESLDISMNIHYLMDLLNTVDCEAVQLAFENENSSILISIPGNDEFKYIVMPMRM